MSKVIGRFGQARGHWVGDGFPVRTLFSYDAGERVSPFLLLDYAGPYHFAPASRRRGVGEHPHRGFETVTIVYSGEVAHRDSPGNGGVVGPGDVQWMTAAAGVLHDEFHTDAFTRDGGPFRMVQLWVNLPAAAKMEPARYQAIVAADIPSVALAEGKGALRVIAGAFAGSKGPARTHTPMNVWDGRLAAGATASLDLPAGHNAMLVALEGRLTAGGEAAGEAQGLLFDQAGGPLEITAQSDAGFLVLTGRPIAEPVVGYGPFVMNTEAEIAQAFADFREGRFGALAA